MSIDSPNIHCSTAGASTCGKVDKPWGYELIWAVTDIYVGKVLFVKAGQSLSLQFHREKERVVARPVRAAPSARAGRGGEAGRAGCKR